MNSDNNDFGINSIVSKENDTKRFVKIIAQALAGEYRETRAGVPHILLRNSAMTYSLVYMERTDRWKIFYPWPSDHQERVYFSTMKSLVEFLDERDLL